MDFQKSCRLCLTKYVNGINIFSAEGLAWSIPSLLEKHFCFKVEESDNVTQYICVECWRITSAFHSLYCKVEVAQKTYNDNRVKEGIGVEFNAREEDGNPRNGSEISFTTEIKNEPVIFVEDLKVEFNSEEDTKDTCSESMTENINPETKPRTLKRSSKDESVNNVVSATPKRNRSSHEPESDQIEDKTAEEIENEAKDKAIREKKRQEEDSLISEYFPMMCEICEYQFPNFSDARSHYRKIHQRAGYLSCCSKRFFYRGGLLDHINVHLNPDIFKCQICEKNFGNKFALSDHMEHRHLPKESMMFSCDKCNRRFAKRYRLNHHMEVSHNIEQEKKERLICDNCGKTFSNKSSILVHIRDVHLQNFLKICEICAKTFNCKKSFKAHCLLHTGQPRMQCNICGRWLKTKDSLRSHLGRHSDTQHTCQYCNKVTPNRQALANHILYFHGERSHKCTLCNKAFKIALGLKEHMASHTGQSLYTCPYCPRTFNSNGNMHKHRKNTHAEQWKKDRGKRLKDLYTRND